MTWFSKTNMHKQAAVSMEQEVKSLSSLSELTTLLCRQFSLIRNNCTGPKFNRERSRARLALCVIQGVGCHYERGIYLQSDSGVASGNITGD